MNKNDSLLALLALLAEDEKTQIQLIRILPKYAEWDCLGEKIDLLASEAILHATASGLARGCQVGFFEDNCSDIVEEVRDLIYVMLTAFAESGMNYHLAYPNDSGCTGPLFGLWNILRRLSKILLSTMGREVRISNNDVPLMLEANGFRCVKAKEMPNDIDTEEI